MTARREFEVFFSALCARHGRAVSDGERRELRARWQAWQDAYDAAQRWDAAHADDSMGFHDGPTPPPSWPAVEARLGLEATGPDQAPRKPAHRLPTGVPKETAQQLQTLLEQRRENRGKSSLTHQRIADRLELSRPRVQRAEKLLEAGWSLLRSDPDFWAIRANDDLVYWPNIGKVPHLLASERSGRSTD